MSVDISPSFCQVLKNKSTESNPLGNAIEIDSFAQIYFDLIYEWNIIYIIQCRNSVSLSNEIHIEILNVL